MDNYFKGDFEADRWRREFEQARTCNSKESAHAIMDAREWIS